MTSRSLGHRAPLLWIVLPMIAGLAAARVQTFAPSWGLLGGACVAAGFTFYTSKRNSVGARAWLCLAMFLAGAASYALHRPRLADWDRLPPREARLSLAIERVFPQLEPGRAAGLATIVHTDEHLRELVGQRVYFSLSLAVGKPAPVRSAQLAALGVIATLPRDPPADTFDGYLANAGVNFRYSRGRVLAEEKPATAYYRFCARQAERFASILGAGVELKRPELVAVLRAMLLGRQHELSDEQETLFRQTGTMHVFSISGLHIAAIALGLYALLMVLRLPRPVQFVAGLTALWLYVDITGAPPSAVRAFVMVALVEASLLFRLPRNPLSALTTSALLVLLVAPLQVFSASFQMSYGIVTALLLLGLPLADSWQSRLGLFRDLPTSAWAWHHHLRDTAWRAALVALALGVAASLVSAVTSVLFFNLFTPGALLANLWLIPVSTIAILVGFVSLLCGLVGFTLGTVLANHTAVLLLWLIEWGVHTSVALPAMWFDATFRTRWLGLATLGLLFAVMIAGYAKGWRGWHRGYWTPFVVVILALATVVNFG